MSTNKEYLGDGVYAQVDRSLQIVLTTENGVEVQNTIFLDRVTASAVIEYIERMRRLQVVP